MDNNKNKTRKRIIIVISLVVLIIVSCFALQNDIRTIIYKCSPQLIVRTISNVFPQQHVCFDSNNNTYYYYDKNKGGICKESKNGEVELIYKCSAVNGIVYENECLFFRVGIKLVKLSLDSNEIIENNLPAFTPKNTVLILNDEYLLLVELGVNYCDEIDVSCFSKNSLKELQKESFSYNCLFDRAFNYQNDLEGIEIIINTDGKEYSFLIPDTSGVYFSNTLRSETLIGDYFVMFKKNITRTLVENSIVGHSGDTLFFFERESGGLTEVISTGKKERIIYADNGIYCIYRYEDRTYSFYDCITHAELDKEKDKNIHYFCQYYYESAGNCIFVYCKDCIVEKLTIPHVNEVN